MTTVRDLVTKSLREINALAAGETAPSDDAALALESLNQWLDSQSLDRLQLPVVTRTTFSITANDGTYFIGSGEVTADGFDTTWTGAPSGWTAVTTGTGAVTNDSSVYQAGGHSVKLNAGTGTASIYRDFVVVSGAILPISLFAKADFTSSGVVYVQNRDTSKYLQVGGSWVTGQESLFEANAGASFAEESSTFTVQDYTTIGASLTTLRVTLAELIASPAWFDTFEFEAGSALPIARPARADQITVNLIDTSTSPDTETPLTMLTEDGWAAVTQKAQTSTIPTHWYYNPTYPYGTLTLWPTPTSSTLQIALYVPTEVSQFASIDDTATLPAGYERMIVKNLALELCPAFEKTPSPLLVAQAAQAMGAVKKVNRRLAELDVSGGFGRRGGYNIWTDQ